MPARASKGAMSDLVVSPAEIVDFATIDRLTSEIGKIVAAAGGFDPLHPGHASNLLEAKRLGDTLVVIVNGDAFLRKKKGKPFQDLKTHSEIVSFIRGVNRSPLRDRG